MIIDLRTFIASHEDDWKQLEKLTSEYEKSQGKGWTIQRIEKFNALYHSTCTDLTEAQTFSNDQELVHHLERIVALAYAQIHSKRRKLSKRGLFHWAYAGFPQAFRRNFRFFIASLAATLAGAIIGGFLVANEPAAKASLFQSFGHLMGDPSERVAREEANASSASGSHAQFSGRLMTHNIRVSLLALSIGVLWGVGTLALLFYNGAILGGVCIDYIQAGEGLFLAGWLLPHGVIEIPAILIAGQGGFVLANTLIGWRNSDSLAQRFSKVRDDIAYLIGGIALMLIWAGIVESYLSQTHEPAIQYSSKITIGIFELLFLCLYLGFGDKFDLVWKRFRKKGTHP